MTRKTITTVTIAFAALSVACKAKESTSAVSEGGAAKGSDTSAMANMPGMQEIAKEITLNASQIQHGNIAWSAAVTSPTTQLAIVPGVVMPNEDRTVRLGAPAAGRVVKVLVRPGEHVRADQSLVTIQSPAAGMAQAEVAKAAAQVGAARAESQYAATARARAERLLALKAIPRQEYERAITDDEQARATLTQAEAEMLRARTTADQLSAGGANGEIVLRAPIAGVVLSRTAVPGAVIEEGSPLVVITDLSTLWLAINAPEPMTGLFRHGNVLRFTVPAYPGDTLSARTESIAAGLDESTRTLTVRALITNAGLRLKPEMLANVIVNGGANATAVLLPDDAVQSIDGKPSVFVVRPDGKGGAQVVRHDVDTGVRAAGQIAVLRGLAAGDLVVTKGAFSVKAQFQKAAMAKMVM